MSMYNLISILIFLFSVKCEEDSCDGKFKYRDDNVLPNLYKLITEKDVYKAVFAGTEYTRKKDQLIAVYWVNGTQQNQKFIVCIPEKAGRVRTKMMISRVTDPNYDGKENRLEDRFVRIDDLEENVFNQIMDNPDIQRYAFVRDPYTRVISMYNMFFGMREKDKKVKVATGFKYNQKVSFEQFVQRLHNFKQEAPGHEKNRHFVPQTASCFVPQGMRYNYILQQQNTEYWWPCFIRKANIYEEMMHGWPAEDQCFLSTKRDPCQGPAIENGVLVNLKSLAWRNANSTLLFDSYYTNKTILNMVTQTFLEDFVNFNFEIKY